MAKETEAQTSTDLEVREEIAAAIGGGDFTAVFEDPVQAARDIVNRILTANTADDVLSQGGAIHASDILGRPFAIHGVKWLKSTFGKEKGEEGSPGVFAVLDAEFLDDGTTGPVTCGARNVMAQILRLLDLGQDLADLPVKLMEIEGTTAAGYKPMWLVRA